MFKENFSEAELEEAKKNGFILTGKTGAGKSTFINVLLGKETAKVERSLNKVTTDPQVYYHRLKNGKCISLVDTPGLSDTDINEEDIDKKHLKNIEETISKEKIHIKGMLFLVNFQEERFDGSEQEALLNYNKIFPLKKFWEHLVVIFTHWFPDPDGDTLEEMIESRNESNGKLFKNLMEKVKDVSNVIDYKNLKFKYFNSYCPVKKDKQKEINEKNRDETEKLLDDFIKEEPLFCQIEIVEVKNEIIKEKEKTYSVDYELVCYFDFNHAPLKTDRNVLRREELIENKESNKSPPPPPTISKPIVMKAKKNEKGNLQYTKEEGNEKNSKIVQNSSLFKSSFAVLSTSALSGLLGYAFLTTGTAAASILTAPVLAPAAAGAVLGYALFG